MDDFVRTGKFLNDTQKAEVEQAYNDARNTPVIALSSAQALSGNDLASTAWERANRLLYDYALAEGLSEITGWYGLDTTSGEILGPKEL